MTAASTLTSVTCSVALPFELAGIWLDRLRLCEPAIDVGDFLHPLQTIVVFHRQDRIERPVEVIGNVGYLLVQAI